MNIIFTLLVVNPNYMLLSFYINCVLSSSSIESSLLADMPCIPYFYSIFSHQLVCAWSDDFCYNKRTLP
jgi:hypothetical protein